LSSLSTTQPSNTALQEWQYRNRTRIQETVTPNTTVLLTNCNNTDRTKKPTTECNVNCPRKIQVTRAHWQQQRNNHLHYRH
jgi:hypothetical protein